MSDTPFDSPHLVDSNKTMADSIRPLAGELPQLLVSSSGEAPTDFSLATATVGPQPQAIYHSIPLICQILMRALRTLADAWLVRYPSFSSTEIYSHAPTKSHTPFDSSRLPDSNETLANSI